MFAGSLSVIGFFRQGAGTDESMWQRIWAPAFGAISLAGTFLIMVFNLGSLLGPDAGPLLTWSIPGIVVVAAIVGLVWGRVIAQSRPEVYRNIGVGEPEPLAVLEHALANVRV